MRLIACCLLLVPLATSAKTWQVCHEDTEFFPWILRSQEGLYEVLAKQASRKLEQPITLMALPWKRCLAEVQAGNIDAVIGIGPNSSRCTWGRYPGKDGCQPDPDYALYLNRHLLYRNRDSPLRWNGHQLLHALGPIAVQPGYTTALKLREYDVQIDESDKEPRQLLRKVAAHMVEAAVLEQPQADRILQENPELDRRIEALSPPFYVLPAYLLISRKVYNQDPANAERLWQSFNQARDSAELQAAKERLGYKIID